MNKPKFLKDLSNSPNPSKAEEIEAIIFELSLFHEGDDSMVKTTAHEKEAKRYLTQLINEV